MAFIENMSAECAISIATIMLPANTTDAIRVHTPQTIMSEATSSASSDPYAINDGNPIAESISPMGPTP